MDQDNSTYIGIKPPLEAAKALEDFIDAYYQESTNYDIWQRVLAARLALHGYPTRLDGGFSQGITKGGSNGQLAKIKVNHFRNIHTHSVNQTTQEEPAFKCIAVNTDSESNKQAELADGLLDYYTRHAELDEIFEKAANDAFCDGEAFILKEWDASEGEPVGMDPTSGTVVTTGEFKFSNLQVEDVIRDTNKRSNRDLDWVITRTFVNKFELAARYPALADQIVNLEAPPRWEFEFRPRGLVNDSDDLPVFTWFHKKTKAVPEGRQMIFLLNGPVLFDGPLPYREIPVYRVAAGDFKNTVFGYSPMWDLLSIQENYDILMSIILTNQKTFGHQVIAAQKGHDISIESIGTALSLLEYTGQEPPKPINFTLTAPEIFQHLDRLEHLFEALSSVSATVRGAPPPNLESGSALAAVYSQFQAYMGKFQRSFKQSQAKLATGIIHDLQDFGDKNRTALIAGKTKKYHVEVFTNKSLNQIDRVVIEDVNPLSKTIQGRVAQAQMMIQAQMLRRPEEFINMLATGNLEPMVEGEQKELDGIREENEQIATGKPPLPALITDNHALHIKEHQGELASMDARMNPAVRNAGLEHIQSHIALLADPNNAQTLMALGQQPLPPPMPPPGMGPPPMPGPPPPGGPHGPPPGPGAEPNEGAPAMPKPPLMPHDPISGQRMSVPGAGLNPQE